jgi:RHS repeat-associated protein
MVGGWGSGLARRALAAMRVGLAALLLAGPGSGAGALGADLGRALAPALLRSAGPALAAGGLALGAVAAGAVAPPARPAAAATPTPGDPWAWGDDNAGELGIGGCSCYYIPPALVVGPGGNGALTDVTAMAAGNAFTLAVRSDGTVWSWGASSGGELGLGTGVSGDYTTPQQVIDPADPSGFLTGVATVAAGGGHALALKQNGTVYGWGYNGYGQVGSNGTTDVDTPTVISGLSHIGAIAAGLNFSLAVATGGGTVWAWGQNDDGQLGQGSSDFNAHPTPAPIPGLSGVAQVAGGDYHVLALLSNGTIQVWGANTWGQLGLGSTSADQLTPTAVPGLATVTAVAAGPGFSLALANGDPWSWGDDREDQLGVTPVPRCFANGNQNPCSASPVQVSGVGGSGTLSGVTALAASPASPDGYALALRADQTAVGWGTNWLGPLGPGVPEDAEQLTPTPVLTSKGGPALGGLLGLTAGGEFALGATSALAVQGAPAGSSQYPPPTTSGSGGDPVSTLSGNFTYTHVDLAIPGRGPAPVFTRTYNSSDTRVGPLGPGWSDSYNLRLTNPGDGTANVLLVGPFGRTDTYTYNATTGLYQPPPAVYTTLVRNSDGSYTATLPDQTTWRFNAAGQLTALADRYGNAASLAYNASGQLGSVGDPAGRGTLAFTYNASGLLTKIADWSGRTVLFGYNGSGLLTQVTDRTGQVTTYHYNATGLLSSILDANGHAALSLTYDGQERVATQQDARGQTTSFRYSSNPTGATITYPANSYDGFAPTVTDTYDSAGRLSTRVTKPDANAADTVTVTYGYDTNSDLTSVQDGNGNLTTYCYDTDDHGNPITPARGNLTRTIGPAPSPNAPVPVTLAEYDTHNNLIETIRPDGVAAGTSPSCSTDLSANLNLHYATDYEYDSGLTFLEAITRTFTDPDLGLQTAVTKYQYGDPANPGQVTRVIPPLGNTTGTPDLSYATSFADGQPGSIAAGLLLTVTDPLGDATSYGYDPVGRRTSMVDPVGNASGGNPAAHTWQYSYDGEDRLTQASAPAPTTGGNLLVTQYQYDPVGNRTATIDANGQVTTYAYDARDSLAQVTQSPLPWTVVNQPPSTVISTTYTYDNLGNLGQVTRAAGDPTNVRATTYSYDGLNRLRQEQQYPAWPSVTGVLTTTLYYDPNGNRTEVMPPAISDTAFFSDGLNRLTSYNYLDLESYASFTYDLDNNRLTMTDPTGTSTYRYDEQDRLTSVTNGAGQTVGYRYDLDGHVREILYPDGLTVSYAYDKAGRLQSLKDNSQRIVGYTDTPDGDVQTISNPNGTSAQDSYDNADRLTAVLNQAGSTTLSSHSYTLDNVGNRTQAVEVLGQVGGGTTNLTTNYTYDSLYRLLSDGTRSYTYDPVGNRLSLTVNGTPTNYIYDKMDRIQSAGSVAYTTDGNGDVTGRGSDSFVYDQYGQLDSATVGGTTTSYTYDGDHRRASAVTNGITTTYTLDVNRNLPVVLSDGTDDYVYGLGLAYAIDRTNHAFVDHTDGLGSVREVTSGSGAIVATYQTDAFGNPLATGGSFSQPFQFAGQQADPTGLYNLRARLYDPNIGRFMQQDPLLGSLSSPLTLNRYTYADDNPATLVDPAGQYGVTDGGGVGGGDWVPLELPWDQPGGTEEPVPAPDADPGQSSVGDQAVSQVSQDSYGPLEGRTNYDVSHPDDPGHTITDIDLFEGHTLWEVKSATWATDPDRWVSENVYDKFARYIEARKYLPAYYREADIGFQFTTTGVQSEFRAAVEGAVAQLRVDNPGVTIHLQWGEGE